MTWDSAGIVDRIAAGAVLLALVAAPAPTWAEYGRPETPGPQKLELVKTGLYMISGEGGNTVVRLSANGMILVDGKLPGQYPLLIVRAHEIVDELPVRLLILTGPDPKYIGTNRDFLRARIPVLAQRNTKEILAQRARKENGIALPSVTFDSEQTIGLGGVTVKVLHFGAARTSGDAVVYFPGLKTVAVGDLYTSGKPTIDACAGGSLRGWRASLRKLLRLDFDTVVPGTGPVVSRAALKALVARIDGLISRHQAIPVCESKAS